MSCAADEPGTERGRRRPLGGAREPRAGGGDPGASPRGAAGPQTGAARTRGALAAPGEVPCAGVWGGDYPRGALSAGPAPRVAPPLARRGGKGRGAPNVSLSRLLGDADAKRAGGFAEGRLELPRGPGFASDGGKRTGGRGEEPRGMCNSRGSVLGSPAVGPRGKCLGAVPGAAPRVAGPLAARRDPNH